MQNRKEKYAKILVSASQRMEVVINSQCSHVQLEMMA